MWFALAYLTKVTDAKTSKADPCLTRYKEENRISVIIKVNKIREKGLGRLPCKLDTNSSGRSVMKLVTCFDSTIKSMDVQDFDWRGD